MTPNQHTDTNRITYAVEGLRDILRSLAAANRRAQREGSSSRTADAVAVVCEARKASLEAERMEMLAISAARAEGATWAALADALGYSSPQAAQQRYSRLTATWTAPEVA